MLKRMGANDITPLKSGKTENSLTKSGILSTRKSTGGRSRGLDQKRVKFLIDESDDMMIPEQLDFEINNHSIKLTETPDK